MLLTPHTIVGIAIATSIPNPFISVPISFLLHFVGDTIPHWDFFYRTKKEERIIGWRPVAVMADLVLGVGVGLTFTLFALWVNGNSSLALNIFLCGIASVFPDILEVPYIYMKEEPKFLRTLTKIQRKAQFQASLPWGLLTQAVVVIVSLLLISGSIVL